MNFVLLFTVVLSTDFFLRNLKNDKGQSFKAIYAMAIQSFKKKFEKSMTYINDERCLLILWR